MKKLINEIIEFGNDMTRHNSASFSSSIAFFFFLSFFPSVMFICSLISYLPVSEKDLINLISDIIPSFLDSTVEGIVNDIYSISRTFVPITAVATLWTAGMGIMGLIRGLNGVLDIEDTRNYFVIRGIATLYTLLMFIALLVVMIFIGFGHSLYITIINLYSPVEPVLSVILKFRTVIVILVLSFIFDVAYSFLPAKHQKMIFQIPGAVLAAIGWWGLTLVYSIYIEDFNGFSIYGNLLAIIAVLFWLYAGFTLLIFGAYFNKYYNLQFCLGYGKYVSIKNEYKNNKNNNRINSNNKNSKRLKKIVKNIDNNG